MHSYSRFSLSLHFQLHKLVHYSCDAFRFRKETTVPSVDCHRKFLNEVTERRCKLEIGATGCCFVSAQDIGLCNWLINLINCPAKLHAFSIQQVPASIVILLVHISSSVYMSFYLSRRSRSNTSPSLSQWRKQYKRLMNV